MVGTDVIQRNLAASTPQASANDSQRALGLPHFLSPREAERERIEERAALTPDRP